MPGIYNNIIQELLVQQHLMRWNKKYTYDEVRTISCGPVPGLHVGECSRDGMLRGRLAVLGCLLQYVEVLGVKRVIE